VSQERTDPPRERPIAELLRELASDTGTLVRQEIELAKAEMTEKVEDARSEILRTVDAARGEATEHGGHVKDEFLRQSKKAGLAVALWAGAAALALGVLAALTTFFILALDGAIPNWAAALVVAAAYAAVAATLFVLGRNRLQEAIPLVSPGTIQRAKEDFSHLALRRREELTTALDPRPEQTIETLKEDVEWAKNPTRSVKR
jgi:putative superfamily III holin-X